VEGRENKKKRYKERRLPIHILAMPQHHSWLLCVADKEL